MGLFDKFKGWYGEHLIARKLKWVNLLGRKGRVLRNIYLPKDDGETSEVDVTYITKKGIFVFESKNYSGWIFGSDKDSYWTAALPGGQKNRFYSPILQNKSHMKWLRAYVGDDIPLFSIIVFSERCELKKITLETDEVAVIKRPRVYWAVRRIWRKNPDVLTDEMVAALYEKLKGLTDVSAEVKARHIESVRKGRLT